MENLIHTKEQKKQLWIINWVYKNSCPIIQERKFYKYIMEGRGKYEIRKKKVQYEFYSSSPWLQLLYNVYMQEQTVIEIVLQYKNNYYGIQFSRGNLDKIKEGGDVMETPPFLYINLTVQIRMITEINLTVIGGILTLFQDTKNSFDIIKERQHMKKLLHDSNFNLIKKIIKEIKLPKNKMILLFGGTIILQ